MVAAGGKPEGLGVGLALSMSTVHLHPLLLPNVSADLISHTTVV